MAGRSRNTQARTAQAFQHEQPAREVGIDHHALSANLHEEAGVADESHAQFAVRGQTRLVGLPAERSYRGMPHQSSELRGALAQRRISKRLLDHPEMP